MSSQSSETRQIRGRKNGGFETKIKKDSGASRYDEVGIVVSSSVYFGAVGAKLNDYFHIVESSASKTQNPPPMYHLYFEEFDIDGLCLWTYRLYDPNRFLDLLITNENLIGGQVASFSLLRDDIASIQDKLKRYRDNSSRNRSLSTKSQTLTIVLEDLEMHVSVRQKERARKVKEAQRKEAHRHGTKDGTGTAVATYPAAPGAGKSYLSLIDDAVAFLVYEMDVDVVVQKSTEDIAEYLQLVTKGLANSIYFPPKTAHECLTKKKRKGMVTNGQGEDLLTQDTRDEIQQLQQTWLNMMQVMPGVSKKRAEQFVQRHSCPRHLFASIHAGGSLSPTQLSELRKLEVFEGDFGEQQKSKKLSKVVYSMLTSTVPTEKLD